MKYYLSNILPRLKKFSASLDQSALLVDKPWVVSSVDEEDEIPRTTLIFRQDGRLHVSIEGEVHDGSWEFLPEANAVLIEQRDKKRLYKHAYLDEAVLALKKDTSSETDDFYVLADENRVPDGDVVGYLSEIYGNRQAVLEGGRGNAELRALPEEASENNHSEAALGLVLTVLWALAFGGLILVIVRLIVSSA